MFQFARHAVVVLQTAFGVYLVSRYRPSDRSGLLFWFGLLLIASGALRAAALYQRQRRG
jgi:hypothetical protein